MAEKKVEETPRKILLNVAQQVIFIFPSLVGHRASFRMKSSRATKSRQRSTTSSHSSQDFFSSSSEGRSFNSSFCPNHSLTRYANIFFLTIGLLQQIPNVSPTGRYVTIVPLFFILTLIAIKEIIEDIKRHNGDRKVNNTKVPVLSQEGKWVNRQWREVKVGDIIRVDDGNYFPADLILLSSSEPQGMCYIETANLDGETNLKIRSSLVSTSQLTEGAELSQVFGQVEAEAPNRRLYEFAGNIAIIGRGRLLRHKFYNAQITFLFFSAMLNLSLPTSCC